MSGWFPSAVGAPASLSTLTHAKEAAQCVGRAGYGEPAVARIATSLANVASALITRGASGAQPAFVFFVPGRIEVLGKHTDYAGGRSLICAIDRGIVVIAVPRADRRLVVFDATQEAEADIVLSADIPPAPGHWTDYVRTVARRLALNFDHATGADIAFASSLPMAAGLSSSSALVIATFLALAAPAWLDDDPRYAAAIRTPEDLAGYLAAVENGLDFGSLGGGRGVGTLGGSQDHTAILCSRSGALSRYAFAPVRHEGDVELPRDRVFAVASSGVRAEKTAAALARYNRLSSLAAQAASQWRERTGGAAPHLGAILEAGLGEELHATLASPGSADAAALADRVHQFLEEAGSIVPNAFDALAASDLKGFGRLVAHSHALADSHLRNQIAETNALVKSARAHGADAASAFGAGFGGSVWAMVEQGAAESFLERWRADYLAEFPAHRESAAFFVTPAATCAVRLA